MLELRSEENARRSCPGSGCVSCFAMHRALLPRLIGFCIFFTAGASGAESTAPMHTLRDFSPSSAAPAWSAQNDGVMGGISEGKATIDSGKLSFTGTLSLENNGGFAQIYSPSKRSDFSEYKGVRLRVKGDGRTYQFRLATDARHRGSRIAYFSEFATEDGVWVERSLPFNTFTPSHHGRMLSGPPLDLTSIRELAFLLGDGRAGAFALEVDWIGLE